MMKTTVRYIVALFLLGISLCLFSCSSNTKQKPQRVIRFAHFTDIHMEPKHNAPKALAQALEHMQALDDKPDLLITGGDHVMDAMSAKADWTDIQYNTLEKVLTEHCRIPIKYCIGNHDVWGWDKENSKTTSNEPFWGKDRAVHEFDLPNRYYSFSKDNWHFIILDSVLPDGTHYAAGLDDEQFQWLRQELQVNHDKHVVIISHIPILSAAAYFDGECEKDGQWKLPRQWMHLDARKLKDLFAEYPNVKLCISGHLHMVDRVEYNRVTYICDGAICGAWWKGDHEGFDEGYGIFDLYVDGTFAHQYISYDWQPPQE
jgi:3',5'-cyclic AMP phosphodiesterase CpdA